MLSDLSYQLDYELNSEYPASAVSSNFSRLLKSGGSYKDSELKKTYKNTYVLETTMGTKAKVAVETFPYRNGSKAVMKVWVDPVVSGNSIDYSKAIKEVKNKLKEIVSA